MELSCERKLLPRVEATSAYLPLAETSVTLGNYPIDGGRPNRVEIAMCFMHSNPGPTEEQHGSEIFHE
jgi:hypothetical protein